jgi:Ran GTPase-activating protein (RanGAP) involved in mRNA processing and transport
VLKSTNLTDSTFQKIIETLPQKLKKLDISYNPNLSLKSYLLLGQILTGLGVQLTSLNIEGNEIGDQACQEVCSIFHKDSSLQTLNMSKCLITDGGVIYLAELLKNSSLSLKTLIIHWNQIKGKGASILAKALKKNTSLQIFDASFNSFGSGPLKHKP